MQHRSESEIALGQVGVISIDQKPPAGTLWSVCVVNIKLIAS